MKQTVQKIDMHLHTHFAGGPERLRGGTWPTPEEIRPIYDRLGIEKGVEMPRCAPERMHDPITSRDAELIAKAFPESVGWWFCYLDPRMGTNSQKDDLSYYIDFFKERGARGIGELQANIFIDDPRMMNLFSAAEKGNLPVTIHFGIYGQGCGIADDIGLKRLDYVLGEFPSLRILGHAMPFWAEIGTNVTEENRNGFPNGKITEEGELAKLMRKHSNLCCDLSANSGCNAMLRDREYAVKFLEEFNERIFFATDISTPQRTDGPAQKTVNFLDEIYLSGELSESAYKNICRENALRILDGNK